MAWVNVRKKLHFNDHDVVDGAPATRFVVRLIELLEEGYGLPSS
jgi:pyruvate/2-oxoglutarate dehydrogenase complex dihydrolipoamide acyltransferase (E2) component